MVHKHHIIPVHAGGSNDPSNIIELTIKEHAEAHRILFEKHGRIEDELAWKGLSAKIGKDEIFTKLCALGGSRSGQKKRGIPRPQYVKEKLRIGSTGNTNRAEKWIVITPNNERIEIFNMSSFCKKNGLDLRLMSRASKMNIRHKGYRCKKVNNGPVA